MRAEKATSTPAYSLGLAFGLWPTEKSDQGMEGDTSIYSIPYKPYAHLTADGGRK